MKVFSLAERKLCSGGLLISGYCTLSHTLNPKLVRRRASHNSNSRAVVCTLSHDKGNVALVNRRLANLMGSFLLFGTLNCRDEALAIKQTLLAGRVPGLSPPDENGMRNYRRPDTKSGGHGIGWSPIIPYTFTVPPDWEEVPVSIADLGGTEIDLRFLNKKEGSLSVVVAPVLRFADTDNARIEDIGTPEKVINAFGPELIGQNVEGKVKSCDVVEHNGRKYYQYEVEAPHALITATAAGNRVYLMTVSGNDPEDADADLVPALAEKVALPVLHHELAHCWDRFSTRTTRNAVSTVHVILNYVSASSNPL